jgi:quinol monooxygenase YgiN
MYGTIARVRIKPGALDKLTEWSAESEPPPGAVAFYTYQMDKDPQEMYLVAVFESRESYVANAEDPATHQRYLQMLESLEGEPEWHDGEIVFHQLV